MTHRHSSPTLDATARSCRWVRAVDLSLSRSPSPFWIGFDRRSTAPIVISPSHRSRSRLRANCDLAFTPIAIAAPRRAISPLAKPSHLSLFLLLSIWPDLMIFFSGFCLCLCTKEWMILYICLAAKKMWATSRKCVFYDIFKNTTKHQKIFFKTFFKMQPNT